MHAFLQLLLLGVATKNVHLLRKGLLTYLRFSTSTCTAHIALLRSTLPVSHPAPPYTGCTLIDPSTAEQGGKMMKNDLAVIFASDHICPMPHPEIQK